MSILLNNKQIIVNHTHPRLKKENVSFKGNKVNILKIKILLC